MTQCTGFLFHSSSHKHILYIYVGKYTSLLTGSLPFCDSVNNPVSLNFRLNTNFKNLLKIRRSEKMFRFMKEIELFKNADVLALVPDCHMTQGPATENVKSHSGTIWSSCSERSKQKLATFRWCVVSAECTCPQKDRFVCYF